MDIPKLSRSDSIPEILRRKERAETRSLKINDTIRREIRIALNCMGWNEAELSRQSGISSSAISRLLTGVSEKNYFDTVCILYETLQMPMSFGHNAGPKAPVSLYIAENLSSYEVPENRQQYISCTPELMGKKVAQIKDDSAKAFYPKGAFVFFSPIDSAQPLVRPLVVKQYKHKKLAQVRIMLAKDLPANSDEKIEIAGIVEAALC